jgi:membrane-bound lytic murein transglycosylase B
MKRITFILVLLSMLTMTTRTAYSANTPTPVSHIPKTPAEKIHLRFSHQVAQIHKEEKLGKLTKAQAKTLLSNVETIRKAEMADLKQNGTKTLTDAQEIEINSQLDALSKTIPVR